MGSDGPADISGRFSGGGIRRLLVILLIVFVILSLAETEWEKQIDADGYIAKAYQEKRDLLSGMLTMERKLPSGATVPSTKQETLIYVLGGNQASLVPRFEKASELYHQGLSEKIHILSRPGITEFSEQLKRNLTNDEWAERELEALKVKEGDIIPVPSANSFFGTYGEAKSLAGIVRKGGYKRLILVSSSHHTRRAYLAFNRFLADRSIELYTYGVNDSPGMEELLAEYVKLTFYKDILFPANQWLDALLDRYSQGRGGDFVSGLS
ncbi:MAG: YdcF family protein [Anaerolineales bacterium]|nr:YdcF family protein [Anaerolineales bacterium]